MALSSIPAILIAFGLESSGPLNVMPTAEIWAALRDLAIALLGSVIISLLAGHWLVRYVRRYPTSSSRAVRLVPSLLHFLILITYAFIVYKLRWPVVARSGFGLERFIIADELVILLPYLIMQSVLWAVLRRIYDRSSGTNQYRGMSGYLVTKARQSFGLVLPIALTFSLGHDLAKHALPEQVETPLGQTILIASIGIFILVVSPALVRIAWSTNRLPGGPARDQLERLATQHKFNYTDILVWNTGGLIANAGVTGLFPFYRYVLLTDGLLDSLEPTEISAVFGHEMGHIAHKHLLYLGFLFLAGASLVITGLTPLEASFDAFQDGSITDLSIDKWLELAIAGLGLVIALALGVKTFGHLSRCFEREADIYGCRAVSCGRAECPPHAIVTSTDLKPPPVTQVCPVGIGIFKRALARVANRNGVRLDASSWRHGSIASRITFLERLEDNASLEQLFATRMRWLRVGVVVGLLAIQSAVLAIAYL